MTKYNVSEVKDDLLFELEDSVPMYRNFMGQFITGGALIWSSMVTFGMYRYGFLIAAAMVLFPMLDELFSAQLRGLSLTKDYLHFRTGLAEKDHIIYLADIKHVEISEKKYRKSHYGSGRKNSVITTKEGSHRSDRDSKCIIETTDGQKHVIKSRYFPEGRFADFLDLLDAGHLESTEKNRKIRQAAGRSEGREAPLVLKKNQNEIDRVAERNAGFLQEDERLRKELDANLTDIYSSIYCLRDEFEKEKMPQHKILHSYQSADGTMRYFLENDYLDGAGEENVEIAENLIRAANENLHIVRTRITYFKKIADDLESLRVREARRLKLREAANKLRELQERNTNKSIEHLGGEPADETDSQTLSALEELSTKVRSMDDLENAIQLKEHISLFKEE